MNTLIPCTTLEGKPILISREKFIFRPAVYGLVTSERRLLLTVSKTTGLYKPPSGGIHLGEYIEDALYRELFEECGICIRIGQKAFFKEDFFYFEDKDLAWHSHLFFFRCEPLTLDITNIHNESEDESHLPQWVEISSLKPEDFQFAGKEIIDALTLS